MDWLFKRRKKTWIFLVICLAQVVASENCSFQPQDDRLECSMQTLESNSSNWNSAKHLVVRCTASNFQESILRTNHFGFLPKLRKLELVGCKIRKIPSLAFSGLTNLAELNVKTGNSEWGSMVMELEKDAFMGLNNLKSLNFTHNNLWTLPESVFCNLNSLTSLNLSTNYLQDVLDLGFASSELSACRIPLVTLDLSSNNLSKLQHKAFGQLRKIRSLNLKGNNLNLIDDDALGGLGLLSELTLSNNKLVALPPELLSEAKHLQELYLHNNSLSVLAPGLFEGLEHLVVLNLSSNEITNDWLTSTTFASLVRLVALDLSHNRLTDIDQSHLNALTSLQILDMSFNRIHSVTGNTFAMQHNLHILKLSHNRIENLRPYSLSGLSVLSSLDLSFNRLKKIHADVLRNCTSLTTIALSSNQFSKVPMGLRVLSKLKTIDLSENSINRLDNSSFVAFNTTSLYGISLANNGIETFDSSIFKPIPNVEVMNLANNRIRELKQGVFNEIKSLRMLRLDNNKLRDINGILLGLNQLQWLNVSSNRLQWFDYAFFPKNLEWLDVHDNLIEELSNYYALGKGFNLKTLNVRSNRIKQIENESLISSLETILLGSNDISSVAVNSFHGKPNLQRVDLTFNQIRQLPLSVLALEPSAGGSSSRARDSLQTLKGIYMTVFSSSSKQ